MQNFVNIYLLTRNCTPLDKCAKVVHILVCVQKMHTFDKMLNFSTNSKCVNILLKNKKGDDYMIKVEVILKNGNLIKGELILIENGTILLAKAEEWYKNGEYKGRYKDFYSLGLTEGQYKECKFIDE